MAVENPLLRQQATQEFHTRIHPEQDGGIRVEEHGLIARSRLAADTVTPAGPDKLSTEARAALERVADGSESQLRAFQPVSRLQRRIRGGIVGAVTVGVTVFGGYNAVNSGLQLPGLAGDRIAASFPAIDTFEIDPPLLDPIKIPYPNFDKEGVNTEADVQRTQDALESGFWEFVIYTGVTIGAYIGGKKATKLAWHGARPWRQLRRVKGLWDTWRGWRNYESATNESRDDVARWHEQALEKQRDQETKSQ